MKNIKIKVIYEKEEELEQVLEKLKGKVKKVKWYKTPGGYKAYIEIKDIVKKD